MKYPTFHLSAYILKDGDHSQMDDHYSIHVIYRTEDEDDAKAMLEQVKVYERRPQVNLIKDDGETSERIGYKDETGIYWGD